MITLRREDTTGTPTLYYWEGSCGYGFVAKTGKRSWTTADPFRDEPISGTGPTPKAAIRRHLNAAKKFFMNKAKHMDEEIQSP